MSSLRNQTCRTCGLPEGSVCPKPPSECGFHSTSPRPTKHDTLRAAHEAVADRGLNYGSPEDNFRRIADLWSTHLENRYGEPLRIDPHDVAMMMVLMKVARLQNQPLHGDSWIDIAGYAACGNNLPDPR